MLKIILYWILKKVGIYEFLDKYQKDIEMLETSLEFLINEASDKKRRWKLKRILTNTRSPFYFKDMKAVQ